MKETKPTTFTTFIATLPESEKEAEKLLSSLRAAGGNIAFQGTYEIQAVPEKSETVFVHYDEMDEVPLVLTDNYGTWLREVSVKEWEGFQALGAVTEIVVTHPRVEKYGLPISAGEVPELWKALIGNLGFRPSEELHLRTQDSRDDSVGHYLLEIKIPAELASEVAANTEKVGRATQKISDGPSALENAMHQHGGKTDEDLQAELKDKLAALTARGGRGVELADEIDSLRLIVAMRKELAA